MKKYSTPFLLGKTEKLAVSIPLRIFVSIFKFFRNSETSLISIPTILPSEVISIKILAISMLPATFSPDFFREM